MPHACTAARAPALAVALMVAANGRIDDHELETLERLDAFGRLGIDRRRFVELASDCLKDIGAHLCERSWLGATDLERIDGILDAVDPKQRLLVCRLAAAAITADGHVSHDERLVYERALTRWRVTQTMVSDAIRTDGRH